MAIFKYAKGVKVEMTKREIKAGTMKLKGWTAEEYRKQYDLFKNKTRAYEAFMGDKGKQSISEMMYRQAKAEHRYGSAYKPSAKMKLITKFPAVSISRGKKMAKAITSAYYQARAEQLAEQVQVSFSDFIEQVKKAKEIDDAIQDPIKKEKALAALADYIHAKQKILQQQAEKEESGIGTGKVKKKGTTTKSVEQFASDPLGEDFNYNQWL